MCSYLGFRRSSFSRPAKANLPWNVLNPELAKLSAIQLDQLFTSPKKQNFFTFP